MDRFSIVQGGLFHATLRRFGLVRRGGFPTITATVTLVLLAWLPPGILAASQSVFAGENSGWGYFTDWTVITRYLVSIWVMMLTAAS